MANTKISGLSSASTPLSGSEILPLNQSGTTDSVTVNNFTNGRSVGMSQANITNNGSLIKLNYAADGGSNLISWINTSSTTLWDMGGGITIRQDEFTIRRQGTNVIYCDNNYNVAFSSGNLVQGTAGKGINFTANTPASGMTSQLLNWYEEGTWTPGQGGGLTVIGTFSSSGTYTRIGRTVFIKGTLSGSTSVAFVGGAVDITNNLPFSTSENALLCWNGNYTATATVITSGTTIYSVTGMSATTSVSFSGTYSV